MSGVMNTYNRYGLSFVKGEGSWLIDENGTKFLDFGCGISVVNLGHGKNKVTEAVAEQAFTLVHTSNLYGNPVQEKLAKLITDNSFADRVFFCNSGAEANEGAIKLARIYGNKKYDGKRLKIITAVNSFHGRTFATLSATGQDKIKDGFRPAADFFEHVPYNDFDALCACDNGDTVAVMLELVQGEGGLALADIDYLKKVREYCTNNGILLIFDEIQTSMGRMGTLFGYENFGVVPDVMTIAKALGNGVPIGCFAAKNEIAEYLYPGTHGSTFGGNYLSSAAGNAVMEWLLEDGFLDEARKKGEYLKAGLQKIADAKGFKVKGYGLMLGLEIGEKLADFIKAAMDNKLLILPAGNGTTRIYAPLTASYEELDYALSVLTKAAEAF